MQYTETNGRTLPLLRLGLGYGALVDETTALWAVMKLVAPERKKTSVKMPRLSFTLSGDAPAGMRGLYLTRPSAQFLASRGDCPEELSSILTDQLHNA